MLSPRTIGNKVPDLWSKPHFSKIFSRRNRAKLVVLGTGMGILSFAAFKLPRPDLQARMICWGNERLVPKLRDNCEDSEEEDDEEMLVMMKNTVQLRGSFRDLQ